MPFLNIVTVAVMYFTLTGAVLKVERRRPALQGREGHVGSGEGRHVGVLRRAERPVLGDLDLAVPRLDDGGRVGRVVPVHAGDGVVLPRDPPLLGVLVGQPRVDPALLEDGKAGRSRGVELQTNVGDVVSLA